MVIDKLLEFSPAQVIDTSGGAYTAEPSTNHVDFGAPNRNLGSGCPLYLVVAITLAGGAGGGDGDDTFTASLVTDSAETFNVGKRTVAQIPQQTLPAAAAATGLLFAIPIPPSAEFDRFARVEYQASQTVLFTVNSFVTSEVPYDHKAYPDAVRG